MPKHPLISIPLDILDVRVLQTELTKDCPRDHNLSAAGSNFCPKVQHFAHVIVKLAWLLVSLSVRKCRLVGKSCPKVQRLHTTKQLAQIIIVIRRVLPNREHCDDFSLLVDDIHDPPVIEA